MQSKQGTPNYFLWTTIRCSLSITLVLNCILHSVQASSGCGSMFDWCFTFMWCFRFLLILSFLEQILHSRLHFLLVWTFCKSSCSWILLMWIFSFVTVPNFLWQRGHTHFLRLLVLTFGLPAHTSLCDLRSRILLYCFPQLWQSLFLSFSWTTRTCLFKL